MKGSTIALGLAGLAGLWWFARNGFGALPPASGLGLAPPGTFDPTKASQMPDYARVVEGIADGDGAGEADWMYYGFPPQDGHDGRARNVDGYYAQLWRPASRISLQTITQGDIERAALFLSGAWKKGAAGGCRPQSYDVAWGGINAHLESVASGLEIGAAIGTGLVNAFAAGWGQAAEASDKSFGFQRGADETRQGKVDLDNIATLTGDVGLSSAISFGAPIRPTPSGTVLGERVVMLNGMTPVGVLPNLFAGNYIAYDPSYADVPVSDRQFVVDAVGGKYLKLGFAYPWHSFEMGCGLSLRERVYVRARMYRTLDLVQALLYPSKGEVVGAGGLVEVAPDEWTVTTGGKNVSWGYMEKRFGKVAGSIFPPLPEDKAAPSTLMTQELAPPMDPGLYTHTEDDTRSTFVPPLAAPPVGYQTAAASAFVPPPPPPPAPAPVTTVSKFSAYRR